MKPTKLTLAGIALAGALFGGTGTAHADDLPGLGVQPSEYFYTGKPYDEDLGGYLFAFRDYDPEINRWTTADPSGFPDGANNGVYGPSPTSQLDPLGLLKWSTLQSTGFEWNPTINGYRLTYNEYTIKANDGTTSLRLYDYVGGMPTPLAQNWGYNCAGYVFADSSYWIEPIAGNGTPSLKTILLAEGYKQSKDPPYGGAAIALWGNAHIANVTGAENDDVTEVTGKRGAELYITVSDLGSQWQGTPTFWE